VLAFRADPPDRELSLVLSSLLALSIGLAGGTAIYQSARTMRRELTTQHQLFAENRAFALRDNFEILEDELKRLALLPTMNAGDAICCRRKQILAGAHEKLGPLQHRRAAAAGRRHLCSLGADRPRVRGQHFGDRSWFGAARAGASGSLFPRDRRAGAGTHAEDRPAAGARQEVQGRAVGVIALADDNLIAPALHENLPQDTDAVLVDETGQIIYPPIASARRGSGWAEAIAAAARGASGTLTAEANGQKALFAFSPVHAATRTRSCSRGRGGR
jgi:hypothetical protein